MSQIQVSDIIIEAETEVSYKFTNNTAQHGRTSIVSVGGDPIEILGDIIRIHGELIRINKYYPFVYKGKKYLLYKPSNNETEIYEIKN
jgi:hypothetical protein